MTASVPPVQHRRALRSESSPGDGCRVAVPTGLLDGRHWSDDFTGKRGWYNSQKKWLWANFFTGHEKAFDSSDNNRGRRTAVLRIAQWSKGGPLSLFTLSWVTIMALLSFHVLSVHVSVRLNILSKPTLIRVWNQTYDSWFVCSNTDQPCNQEGNFLGFGMLWEFLCHGLPMWNTN